MNDTDTLTGYPPGLPLLDEEVHEAVNMDVDAATSSLVAESQPVWPPHNRIVLNLLFELATWHALAKLRLHTETTINALEASTKRLGKSLREFKSVTCETYVTKELPSEEAARGRRESALRAKQPASNGPTTNTTARRKREKKFNLSTYKLHALGDYPHTIRMFGTTDGYTSQVVGYYRMLQ
ncbi:hypothetical protein F5887DRAFT_913458 [Amanita rubescens]|nr:hypothetical protein F5887DRAFT_913458 [Amanita rubescens]